MVKVGPRPVRAHRGKWARPFRLAPQTGARPIRARGLNPREPSQYADGGQLAPARAGAVGAG